MSKYTPSNPQLELPFDEIPYGYCHCGCGEKTNIVKASNPRYGWIKGEPLRFISGHNSRSGGAITLADRFWQKVGQGNPDDCWLWQSTVMKNGYGHFWNGKGGSLAHRTAYELHYGPISKSMFVCHRCDVKLCCNPAHLFLGTPQDNMDDMVVKGRGNKPKGERHGLARFTNAQAKALREEFERLNMSVGEFARIHNVPDETMRRLINRITYQNA